MNNNQEINDAFERAKVMGAGSFSNSEKKCIIIDNKDVVDVTPNIKNSLFSIFKESELRRSLIIDSNSPTIDADWNYLRELSKNDIPFEAVCIQSDAMLIGGEVEVKTKNNATTRTEYRLYLYDNISGYINKLEPLLQLSREQFCNINNKHIISFIKEYLS